MNDSPVRFSLVMKAQKTQQVGCENDRGTLNIHLETETCEVCVRFCNCIPVSTGVRDGKCVTCDKPLPPGTWADRLQ